MSNPTMPDALVATLRRGHRFVVTSHINPDGDAVGSSIGITRLLRKLGKGGTVWLRDDPPGVYQRLPGYDSIHVGEQPPAGFPDAFDGAIVMECPSLERSGLAEHLAQLPLINIDHHLGNGLYGQVNWVDSAAPSVGEMVFRLARELRITIDEATANGLFMTLVTDTGGFRFSNATAEAFEAAAELVREGASPEQVSQWLYESQREAALRLVGEMLSTLELHDEGRIATAWLTRDMVARTGAGAGDSEGLVDYPRSIDGVEAVALFRELEGGGVKASLRSRGQVNVERVARQHGGGGHQNAAGFASDLDKQELQAKTIDDLRAALGSAS